MVRGERAFVVLVALLLVAGILGLFVAAMPGVSQSLPFAAPPASIPSPAATAPATIGPPPSPSTESADLLARHNALRARIGAPAARADARVTAAAQRHAEYLATNDDIGHDEDPARPGFSGRTVRDRLQAIGHDAQLASEVAARGADGPAALRLLWDLPYHRLGLMHPQLASAGWGVATRGGQRVVVGVLVFDFAASAPALVRSPTSGERDVPPSWDGRETPDPLPPGAVRPVGWPIVVMAGGGKRVEVRGTRLVPSGGGAEVPLHVAPHAFELDYAAVIPLRPLDGGTTYRVRLNLLIAGVATTEEWEFTTSR